jgi:hypothetical protein
MGIGDTKLTYAIDLNYGLENEKPFEVDFTFWYQRDHLLDHAEAPALVFGEAAPVPPTSVSRRFNLADIFDLAVQAATAELMPHRPDSWRSPASPDCRSMEAWWRIQRYRRWTLR